VSGKVRLATREAFGAWLVCPRINRLKRRHPDLKLGPISQARNISLLKRDADITVSLRYPSLSPVIVQKLTDYRLGLFASRDYLREYGPRSTSWSRSCGKEKPVLTPERPHCHCAMR
jgi:DNA-binding transcriptional LysR family regulator